MQYKRSIVMPPFLEAVLARLLVALPKERFARAVGRVTSARLPAAVLAPLIFAYARAFGVDMGEASVPDGGFRSFDAFFARRLVPGARTIEPSPNVVVVPSDGALVDAGAIRSDRTLTVKGQDYRVTELLDGCGEEFADGVFALIYLSPRDYHRVHVPCDARVESVRHVPGALFPVNDFGVRHVPRLFARNERVVVMLRSPTFGRLAVVLVGAGIVGRIDLTIPAPPRPPIDGEAAERRFLSDGPRVRKGDDLGAFVLGSTVIVFGERTAEGAPLLFREPGGRVRVGEPLFRRGESG